MITKLCLDRDYKWLSEANPTDILWKFKVHRLHLLFGALLKSRTLLPQSVFDRLIIMQLIFRDT